MSPRITSIAINAMGGHGGGVLADWIARTAEAAGYFAQVTSVPGFAQRSGATIYYVEIFPREEGAPPPIFALMAVPGDVDVVIASELAEGGRAVLRGLVTPDRTTLISSSHREYTTDEKLSRFDGRRDSAVVFASCDQAAKRFVCFDMREVANQSGCLVSAVLFGALAGSGALPFEPEACRETIRRGDVAVAANLRGFALGHERAAAGTKQLPVPSRAVRVPEERVGRAGGFAGRYPAPVAAVVERGVARLIDYQDEAYARRYLDRVDRVRAVDDRTGDHALTAEVARLLALRMAHEDVIRVADIKTRRRRFADVARENRLEPEGVWDVTEFLAPRPAEILDLMPAAIGRRLAASPVARRWLDRILSGGFTIRTSRLRGFLLLYGIARLRRLRPHSLGHVHETELIEGWLDAVVAGADDPAFALETAALIGLVRGYGSTLERGRRQYRAILAQLETLRGRADGAVRLAELREAALADEDGAALARAIAGLAPRAEAA